MNSSKTRTIGQYRCRNLRYSGKKLRWLSFCSDLTTYFVACMCARSVHGCEKTSRDVWSCEHENHQATAFSLGSAAFVQKQPVVKINEQFQPEPSHPGVSARVSQRFLSSEQTKPWSECVCAGYPDVCTHGSSTAPGVEPLDDADQIHLVFTHNSAYLICGLIL